MPVAMPVAIAELVHDGRRRFDRSRRPFVGAIALVAVALIAVSCTMPVPAAPSGPNPDDAPAAGEARYLSRGPFVPGVTTLDLGGRPVEVTYPADPSNPDVRATPIERADARAALPPSLAARLTPGVDLTWDTGARRNVPVARVDSGGEAFPVVLNVHGFFLWRTAQQTLASHLASWGMIVASPDFDEFGLAAIDRGIVGPDTDGTLDAVVARLAAEHVAAGPGHPLAGAVDVSRLAVIGHSFGAVAATAYASRPAVRAWVPLASGSVPGLLMPRVEAGGIDKASLWLASSDDVTGAAGGVTTAAAATLGPRSVVVLPTGGHSGAYTDLCFMGGSGFVAQLATVEVSLPNGPALASGCSLTGPDPAARAVVAHFVTATMRYRLGLDDEPVGLGTQVLAALPVTATFAHLP